MIKKDYVVIANCINRSLREHLDSSIRELVNNLCIELKADNPRFNEKKFKEACLDGTY